MSSKTAKLDEKTLDNEQSLPSLPVPPLKLTCKKYLESVKPCVTHEEFLETKAKVEEFCNGVGLVLQNKLEKRAQMSKNWLEQWWEEYAYMRPRYPIAPTVNVAGPILMYEDIWPPKAGTQITRTAIMLHFLLKEWKLLYSQERPVDRKDGTPLSMSQYYHIMSYCRIPGQTIDRYVEAVKTAPAPPTADYITVITRGRIYKCVILNAEYDPIDIPDMERQFQHIVEDASKKPLGPGLGSLTSENRTVWADAREYLLSYDANHREMIEVIQNSLLTVVLEDYSPSLEKMNLEFVGGNCQNRWFDKSFQMISFRNGLLGVNVEHLAFDAIVEIVTVMLAVTKIRTHLKTSKQEHPSTVSCSAIPTPIELEFRVDLHLHKQIKAATKQFHLLTSNVALTLLHFNDFGKKVVKHLRVHPDTFVQMAAQLTHCRLHSRMAPTYETSSTRAFYHGRTETVRSLSQEAKNWCGLMENPAATAASKAKLLRIACQKHDELMDEAQNGLGIDRHLLGLKILAEQSGMPLPGIYTDTAWTKSGGDGNFVLSTSLIGYFPVIGFTLPMIEDGYGCFYSIQKERFNIMITTYRSSNVTDCRRFSESMRQSLRDMRNILVESKL